MAALADRMTFLNKTEDSVKDVIYDEYEDDDDATSPSVPLENQAVDEEQCESQQKQVVYFMSVAPIAEMYGHILQVHILLLYIMARPSFSKPEIALVFFTVILCLSLSLGHKEEGGECCGSIYII